LGFPPQDLFGEKKSFFNIIKKLIMGWGFRNNFFVKIIWNFCVEVWKIIFFVKISCNFSVNFLKIIFLA
jgi:hypothetical protein